MTDIEKLMAGLMALATATGHAGVVQGAMEPPKETMIKEPPTDHDALVKRAEELGIKVDKRWGDDRLVEEIAATDTE